MKMHMFCFASKAKRAKRAVANPTTSNSFGNSIAFIADVHFVVLDKMENIGSNQLFGDAFGNVFGRYSASINLFFRFSYQIFKTHV